MSQRPFHIVVYGATSFVGEILSRYLATRVGVSGTIKWAIAGRSATKLQAVRTSLGASAASLPILLANADDESSLRAMCEQAQVVISTVGPYALYGENLIRACVSTGTDYCDLTGEVQWIKRMIDAHEPAARQSGARIVHCCGFDSIPSDLGVHFLQHQSLREGRGACSQVRMRVKGARGGFSGGTVASLLNVVKEALVDAQLRRDLQNPYLICPPRTDAGPTQPEVVVPEHDAVAGGWVAPFVMAGINTRVVHRSNAVAGYPWGAGFLYDEATLTGDGLTGRIAAYALTGGMGAFMAAAAMPPTRWLLERFVLPKPGEGPSPEAQETGWFDLRFHGTRADGSVITVKVTGDRDPGYGSTAKMLGEAALCLALDTPHDQVAGGFWTPATAMGERLIERLVQHAGLGFSVLP